MQLKLFLAFFRVGILGYGGGPASIPLVHKEVVEHYRWLSENEFGDVLALGNTLPGPIVTKMAGYIGYARGGILGALNSVIAVMMPTVVLMISLFLILSSYREQPWVNGITNGVLPVVTVMMGALTWKFIKKSNRELGWKIVLIMLIIASLIIGVLSIHPAIVIGVLLIVAIVQKDEKKGDYYQNEKVERNTNA